jgi:hypothetical protein
MKTKNKSATFQGYLHSMDYILTGTVIGFALNKQNRFSYNWPPKFAQKGL